MCKRLPSFLQLVLQLHQPPAVNTSSWQHVTNISRPCLICWVLLVLARRGSCASHGCC
jgi:hypothetical protein